jgi:hypothetical protein
MGRENQGRKIEPAVVGEMIRMRLRRCSLRTVERIMGVHRETVAKYAPMSLIDRLREIAPDVRGVQIDIAAGLIVPRNGGATPCVLAREIIGER